MTKQSLIEMKLCKNFPALDREMKEAGYTDEDIVRQQFLNEIMSLIDLHGPRIFREDPQPAATAKATLCLEIERTIDNYEQIQSKKRR